MLLAATAFTQVTVTNTRTEKFVNPLGIDRTKPEFSWQLQSNERNIVQSAYEIRVAETAANLLKGKNLVWNPGKVSSSNSLYIKYDG